MRVVVEDAHLAIEDQRAGWQTADGGGDLTKPLGVVDATAADEADAAPVLVGDHAPAVVFFLVHEAVAVEGLRQDGLDQVKTGEHPAEYARTRWRTPCVRPAPWYSASPDPRCTANAAASPSGSYTST